MEYFCYNRRGNGEFLKQLGVPKTSKTGNTLKKIKDLSYDSKGKGVPDTSIQEVKTIMYPFE